MPATLHRYKKQSRMLKDLGDLDSDLDDPRREANEGLRLSYEMELPAPWERESPMTRELFTDRSPNGKARFHLIDPWHTIHLGIGKSWVASGIIMIQALLPQSCMDDRIGYIASKYKTFCREHKLDAIVRKIDLSTFGSTSDPIGTWNKAAVTSNFMMFLEHFCEEHSEMIQPDVRLRVFVSCTNMVPF